MIVTFSDRLKEQIEYQGWNLEKAAQEIGISKSNLDSYIKSCERIPNVEAVVKISQALGVSVEYLITGEFISNNSYENIIQELKLDNCILRKTLVSINQMIEIILSED